MSNGSAGAERSAHACERGGQQLNGRRIQNDEQAQLIRCGTLAAAAHTAGGADAERRGRVAEPQKVGGEVGGDRGQRLAVAARVRQEPLEQRAEEGSEAVGEMTLVHHFHHARPEAHHAAHRQTQLDRALRALECGSAERIQVSRQRAENERDCHHSVQSQAIASPSTPLPLNISAGRGQYAAFLRQIRHSCREKRLLKNFSRKK